MSSTHPLRLSSAVIAALIAVLALAGCSAPQRPAVESPPKPTALPKVDLQTPEASVRTYLAWTSLAYRMANSDVTSKTVGPYENVRVDAYIELNRQKNQGIDQALTALEVRGVSTEGTRAVVATKEQWKYRYFSLDKVRYTSAEHTASYDATYTLVHEKSGWLVDEVQATALTKVE